MPPESNPFFDKPQQQRSSLFVRAIQFIAVIATVLALVYIFIVPPNQIDGMSMSPNFADEEIILTNRIPQFLSSTYNRGDIVVFRHPLRPEQMIIKRVIGKPGDNISLKDGNVFVNGIRIQEQYLAPGITTRAYQNPIEGDAVVVPPNSYYLMGDNRSASEDSRYQEFAFIDSNQIVGLALAKVTNGFTLIEHGGLIGLEGR